MTVLDSRLVLAFNAHRTRLWRVVAGRLLAVAVALAVALTFRHWGTWVLFGVVAVTQGIGAVILVVVSRMPGRYRARLETNLTDLAWLHAAPEPRTKLHRVELHDPAGEMTILFVPSGVARGTLDAARELAHAPMVTTNDVEHAAAASALRARSSSAR